MGVEERLESSASAGLVRRVGSSLVTDSAAALGLKIIARVDCCPSGCIGGRPN
ncbi:hypothetical protein ACRALDRAFT_2030843 [Sodiomyces alcalophilus JCM 7366]|uniref:uncharacterized protein n=1 Tax=Sodiomyces alcalophilus JCM 7366 TaxID=591952 RepID=UPI0039B57768